MGQWGISYFHATKGSKVSWYGFYEKLPYMSSFLRSLLGTLLVAHNYTWDIMTCKKILWIKIYWMNELYLRYLYQNFVVYVRDQS